MVSSCPPPFIFLTDDDAADGPGPLDMSGLLCKHALAPLQQGDAALDKLAVGQLSAATVGLRYSHKASHLQYTKTQKHTQTTCQIYMPAQFTDSTGN